MRSLHGPSCAPYDEALPIMAVLIAGKAIGCLATVAVRSTEWDVNRHNFAR